MNTKELIERVLNEDQTLGHKETKFAWGTVRIDAPWYVDKRAGYIYVAIRLSFIHSFNPNDTGVAGEHTIDNATFTWSGATVSKKTIKVSSLEEAITKAKEWGTKAFAKWSK